MFLPPTSYQPIAYDYNAEWHESALQKKNRNITRANTYSPLLLALALAACGGGGGGLGKPNVRTTDDGIVFSQVWENTKLVSSDSNETVEKLLEKNNRAIAEAVGKSPGKPTFSNIEVAPDGKSATYRIEYPNAEFSFLSENVKIELVGDDAEFFRMEKQAGLGSKIEFITAPNYERPSDKDADNTYKFSLKFTFTSGDGGEPEIEYYRYFVSVSDATGTNDPGEEPNILRAITLPENTIDKIASNLFTLNRLNGPHNVFFKNSKESEDGSSSTIKMHDKATGHISEVTVKIVGPDAAAIKFMLGNDLYFRTAPDYENPTDSNEDNVYEFSLVYTGLKQPETTDFRITITDLAESASSQGRSSQSVEIVHPDSEDYIMPESQDLSPPSEFI